MKQRVKTKLAKIPFLFWLLRFGKNMVCDYPKWLVFKFTKNWVILNRIDSRLRPLLWRLIGVNLNTKITISYDVYLDVNKANLITIEEGVMISPRVSLLCHKRNLHFYFYGDLIRDIPYISMPIVLKKGCQLGLGCIILPGVTIGEGAVVGSGSVVTKDVPAWTIVAGNPAKIIRQISKREETKI